MNDTPSRVLAEILKARPELLDDWRLCEALLRDHCGAHEREINLLVSALREGVPSQLQKASQSSPLDVIYKRLVLRLHNRQGIDEGLASWAVGVWAQVLGLGLIGAAGGKWTARPSKPSHGASSQTNACAPPSAPAMATPAPVARIASDFRRAITFSLIAMALLIGFVLTQWLPDRASDPGVAVGTNNRPNEPSKPTEIAPRPPIENGPPTASTPPAEATPAILNIHSVPGGSSVTVGLKLLGTTDRDGRLRVAISPGEHSILIQRLGYSDHTQKVRLTSGGETRVAANLKVKRSTLAVSTATGARVEIDGVPAAISPAEVPPGNHVVRVTKLGHVPFQESVYVPPGEDVRVNAVLAPTREIGPGGVMQRLEVASNPVGADAAKPSDSTVIDVAEPPNNSSAMLAPPRETETIDEASFRAAIVADDPKQVVQKSANAIRAGRRIRLAVNHDYRLIRIHMLRPGTLTISQQGLVFESPTWPSDNFAIGWANVKEVKENRINKRDHSVVALELEVDRLVNGKRDGKNYKFVSGQAWIGREQDVQCRDCVPLMPTLVTLIRTMRAQ